MRIRTFLSLLLLFSFSAIGLQAQDRSFKVTYELKFTVPEQVLKIEDEALRQRYIEAYEAENRTYYLVYSDGISGFSEKPLTDGKLELEGKLATFVDYIKGYSIASKLLADKAFLIRMDTLQMPEWEMVEGQHEEIVGNMCNLATTAMGQLKAWYCPAIPAMTGPIGLGGLPGMILKVVHPQFTCTAVAFEVIDQKIVIPEPQGHILTVEEFQEKAIKFMQSQGMGQ